MPRTRRRRPIVIRPVDRLFSRYVVVRHSDDGYDWLALGTIASTAGLALENGARVDAEIPHWAEANAIIGTARIRIEVTETEPLP